MKNKSSRNKTEKKLIYCKWINGKEEIPTKEYISSWRNETIEEKERNKKINKLKKELLGQMF